MQKGIKPGALRVRVLRKGKIKSRARSGTAAT